MRGKAVNKIIIVIGARPNFPKVAPIIKAFNKVVKNKRPKVVLVHTGQHYDYKLSKVFFEELDLPQPDYYLGVGSGSHAVQTAKVMTGFEKVLIREKPDLVMVVGDVNSTLACALTAHKMGIKVAHVEAGLRSYDRNMPEEANRLLTDHLSDYLLVSCPEGMANLKKEGIERQKIFYVGNVMIDTLKSKLPKTRGRKILSKLNLGNNKEIAPYCLVTLHRPSNVDTSERLSNILGELKKISKDIQIIMTIHPRTMGNIKKYRLTKCLETPNICCLEPVGYLDFIKLEMAAKLVITDSGGIQEETSWLGVPCFTVRENTERPVTIKSGTNQLLGIKPGAIIGAWHKFKKLKFKAHNYKGKIPGWNGKAAESIVKEVIKFL